ncbi:synapse differentiation-inducing gene protein 1-like [Saccostrea echinata]|uniref:synapse differentiation-inducing gene protein 1-like n=1 Tax=Saccostrea echinata TaxID=191078 RepID=UPI002A83EA54|nr:synapse differentiation-inducing gene protein 1-like [Saccostrea echinata]
MSKATPFNAGYNQGLTTYQSGLTGYQQRSGAKVYGSTPAVTTTYSPTNWLCPAIFSCLFCFWPLGLAAIYYAWEANQREERNDLFGAEQSASCARTLTYASIFVGVIMLGVSLALFFTLHQKTNHHL